MIDVVAAPVDRSMLVAQLQALGVQPGGVLLVHTAFSKVRPVEGGPAGLIDALQTALGPGGTLVMPSMTDVDDEPFRPEATPCRGMGVVADTFWRQPGVLRSDSPHAFAARGPAAAVITAPQPIEIPHGPDSPVGRVHVLDGQVLLLGVGHDASTTLHLAEEIAAVPYRREYASLVVEHGAVVEKRYSEPDHCCGGFALADRWLDADGRQRRGPIGHAEARLVRSRDLVEAALARLRREPTVFLHTRGLCEECDDAWRSIAS
jgi:aminoglycoside 3-N-acetyltransferase